jgi:NADH-quinone oxidoreductase subunit C
MSVLEPLSEQLEALGVKPVGPHAATMAEGSKSLVAEPRQLVPAVQAVKEAGFEMLSDIFGIDYLDYPGYRGKRFAVVYNLYSIEHNARLFLRVYLDDGETLPTITHLWKGASFMEREVYDMFGVEFDGHPDLRKLITPEDLDGHPHRKDFPLGETPTLFNEGRFLDPATFRAGIAGKDKGLTGWRGGARRGVRSGE